MPPLFFAHIDIEQNIKYNKNGNITKYDGTEFVYDSTVKDKLIRVGGNTVSYANAASLNPTSWNGRSYGYEGRRLTSFGYTRNNTWSI